MLRFFRQFRHQLLTENRFRKYLLYAVGEIFLVVIGILIALQINNWNEARKEKIKEGRYLIQLKEEFEDNLKITEGSRSNMKKLHTLTEIALKVHSGDTVIDPRLLALAVEFASYGGPPNVKENVWQDLVSSGNTDLLVNTRLRTAISEYYRIAAMHRSFHKDNWVDDQNATYEMTSAVLSWKDRLAVTKTFGTFLQDSAFPLPEISIDYDTLLGKIKSLPDFEAKLFTIHEINRAHLLMDANEIDAILDILRMLEQELTKLDKAE